MPNSKMKNVARKHRKAKERWKAKRKVELAKAKVRPAPKKKASVFDRARNNPPLAGASPSAVSNPSGEVLTASQMLFPELMKATNRS